MTNTTAKPWEIEAEAMARRFVERQKAERSTPEVPKGLTPPGKPTAEPAR